MIKERTMVRSYELYYGTARIETDVVVTDAYDARDRAETFYRDMQIDPYAEENWYLGIRELLDDKEINIYFFFVVGELPQMVSSLRDAQARRELYRSRYMGAE